MLANTARYQPLRLAPTLTGIAAFVCGIPSLYKFNLIGEAYVTEMLLFPAALLAAISGGAAPLLRQRLFWIFCLGWVVTMSGYVLSDLVAESSSAQYLRGWGRVGLTVTDFIGLSLLVAKDRRNLWWFTLGAGLGGILFLRLTHTPISIWKFGYGDPMALFAAAMSYFIPTKLASLIFVFLGIASIHFDTRNEAGICMLLAALLWGRSAHAWKPLAGAQIWKVAVPAGFVGALLLAGLAITAADFDQRREASNIGRSIGLEIGLKGIANSPLLGYGSWTDSKELSRLQREAVAKELGEDAAEMAEAAGFTPHSQILQAWIEGGLLGACFFLIYGYLLLRSLKPAALLRPMDALTPIYLYFLLAALWNLIMSPFSAPHRLQIALGAATLVAIAMERRMKSSPSVPPAMQVPAAARQNN